MEDICIARMGGAVPKSGSLAGGVGVGDTNICQLRLLGVIDAGNLNLSLGHKVVLVDVRIEEEFFYMDVYMFCSFSGFVSFRFVGFHKGSRIKFRLNTAAVICFGAGQVYRDGS